MASPSRTNLFSLLALLVLVAVVAITPEARSGAQRLADWIEGVRQERAEIQQREAEQRAKDQQKIKEQELAHSENNEEHREESMSGMAVPEHTVLGEDGKYRPEPGYVWYNDDSVNFDVVWTPGMLHPENPRVVASAEPDQWVPAPGYDWVEEKGVNDLRVAWKPGKVHSRNEHVLAAQNEGEWMPDAKYMWANDDPADLTVVLIGED